MSGATIGLTTLFASMSGGAAALGTGAAAGAAGIFSGATLGTIATGAVVGGALSAATGNGFMKGALLGGVGGAALGGLGGLGSAAGAGGGFVSSTAAGGSAAAGAAGTAASGGIGSALGGSGFLGQALSGAASGWMENQGREKEGEMLREKEDRLRESYEGSGQAVRFWEDETAATSGKPGEALDPMAQRQGGGFSGERAMVGQDDPNDPLKPATARGIGGAMRRTPEQIAQQATAPKRKRFQYDPAAGRIVQQ